MIAIQALSFRRSKFLMVLSLLALTLSSPLLAEIPPGWPDVPLDMAPRAGVVAFEERALFEAWPFFSEDHIVAGTTSVSKLEESGDRLLAGSLMVAWNDDDGAHASRGAFVIRVSPSGERLAEAYFGALPYGSDEKEYALLEVEVAEDMVLVGGWVRPSRDAGDRDAGDRDAGGKDVFLAQLSADLVITHWTRAQPPGLCAGGDEIRRVDVTGSPGAIALAGSAPEPASVLTHPDDVEFLVGHNSNCDDTGDEDACVTKVAASNNDYARIFGVAGAGEQGGTLISTRFSYPIPEDKPKLTGLNFEITNDDCMEVRVSLGGGDAPEGVFYSLAPVQVCDEIDPVIPFAVSKKVARRLGFWNMSSSSDLIAQVDIEIFGGPSCGACLGGGVGSGVDESTASSEVADP